MTIIGCFTDNQLLKYTCFSNGTACVGDVQSSKNPTAISQASDLADQSVVIPQNITFNKKIYIVTSLYSYALYKCSIKSLSLPPTIIWLGLSSIDLCYMKSSLILPESLEYIYSWALSSNRFQTIKITKYIKYLGEGCLAYNTNLNKIELDSQNKHFAIDMIPPFLNSFSHLRQFLM